VVLIHGHTHVPYAAMQFWGMATPVLLPIRYGVPQPLNLCEAVLINPGSVGLPRNPDPLVHAAYGILDTDASTFEFRRVPYDSERMRLAIQRREYDGELVRPLIKQLEGAEEHSYFWSHDPNALEWKRHYREQSWGWEPIRNKYQR
jgi:hypothetical protein